MLRLFLVVGLAIGLSGCIVAPPYGYAPAPGMDTPTRPRTTRRQQLAWGSGLVVGDVVGGGDRFRRASRLLPSRMT
jgi:hypothetical protein